MIKWLINRDIGNSRANRWFCLPNPELLNELANEFKSRGRQDAAGSKEFSPIVSAIWVNETGKLTSGCDASSSPGSSTGPGSAPWR